MKNSIPLSQNIERGRRTKIGAGVRCGIMGSGKIERGRRNKIGGVRFRVFWVLRC